MGAAQRQTRNSFKSHREERSTKWCNKKGSQREIDNSSGTWEHTKIYWLVPRNVMERRIEEKLKWPKLLHLHLMTRRGLRCESE